MAFFDHLNSQRAVAILAGDAVARAGATDAEKELQRQEAREVVHFNSDASLRDLNEHMLCKRRLERDGKPATPYRLKNPISFEELRDLHVQGWYIAALPTWWPFGQPQLVVEH